MNASAGLSMDRTLAGWAAEPGSARVASAGAAEPPWLLEYREAARKAFVVKGFPGRGHEAWRHMGLDGVLIPAWHAAAEDYQVGMPMAASGLHVEFWDRMDRLPDAVTRLELAESLSLMNANLFKKALAIRVDKNSCSLQPMRISAAPAHGAAGNWMTHPRLSVNLDAGSRLDLVIALDRLPDSIGLVNAVMDISLDEQTALNLIFVGPVSEKTISLLELSVRQKRDSVLRMFTLETRPGVSRMDVKVRLNGTNASAELFGLALLGGPNRSYQHIQVDHLVPHTQSRQVYKSVLAGSAQFEYDSLVTVHREAEHSSSDQLNKNLLLSDSARAFARPQLAINTDEVQCHHGATVGQMNAEELQYLRTRGIDPQSASALVLLGFVDDLLKEIPVPAASAELHKLAHSRLRALSA